MADTKGTTLPKRPPGRPVTRPMPERIPDTAENIARAIFRSRPKKAGEWKYMKKTEKPAE